MRTIFQINPMLMATIAAICALLISGCPPWRGEPDGCASGSTRCSPNGVPQVCSPSRYWTNADRPCADNGAVCCVVAYQGQRIHSCSQQSVCAAE